MRPINRRDEGIWSILWRPSSEDQNRHHVRLSFSGVPSLKIKIGVKLPLSAVKILSEFRVFRISCSVFRFRSFYLSFVLRFVTLALRFSFFVVFFSFTRSQGDRLRPIPNPTRPLLSGALTCTAHPPTAPTVPRCQLLRYPLISNGCAHRRIRQTGRL